MAAWTTKIHKRKRSSILMLAQKSRWRGRQEVHCERNKRPPCCVSLISSCKMRQLYKNCYKNRSLKLMHCWLTIQSCDKWKTLRHSLKHQAAMGKCECFDLEDEPMPLAGSEHPMGTKKTRITKKTTSSFSLQDSFVDFITEVSSSSTRNELRHQDYK